MFVGEGDHYPSLPVIVTECEPVPAPALAEATAPGAPRPVELPVADLIKSLIHFLANRPLHMPLWQYEDITAKGNRIRLCLLMNIFLFLYHAI